MTEDGTSVRWPDLVQAADRSQTLTDLAELLRRLRRRHARQHHDSQLTVRELASRSGYAVGAISHYLNGRTLPPIDRFDVLIRLLGASPAEQRALANARDRVEEHRRAGAVAPARPIDSCAMWTPGSIDRADR